MASRILDMGDMLTLIEQAEKAFDADQAARAAAKLTGQGGEFTLDDFLEQMQRVRKMGSLTKIMGMLPGMGQFREQLENFDEREIDRIQAMIQSMTPGERANPKMIDGSRRARIAQGSGRPGLRRQRLVDRFFEARKMMLPMAARRRHARHAGRCPAWAAASAPRPSRRRRRRARASASRATRRSAAEQEPPRRRPPPPAAALGVGRRRPGFAPALDLPADLSSTSVTALAAAAPHPPDPPARRARRGRRTS